MPTDVFMPSEAGKSEINNTEIGETLNMGTSVTISTVDTPDSGNQKGDITVSASINKTAGPEAGFTLEAANDILVNSDVKNSSPAKLNLALTADGDITINKPIELQGGNIELRGVIVKIDGAQISSSTTGNRNAGSVTVNADTITLINRAAIESKASGTGQGGVIFLKAKKLLTLNNSTLLAEVNNVEPVDAPRNEVLANITLDSPTINIGPLDSGGVKGAVIKTLANGTRNAGSLTVTGNILMLDGFMASRVNGGSSGTGGSLTVTGTGEGNMVTVTGQLISDNFGTKEAKAGSVTVTGETVRVAGPGTLSANTAGEGPAGSVTVTGTGEGNMVMVTGGTLQSQTFGKGPAGSVTVTGETVRVDGLLSSKAFVLDPNSTQAEDLGQAGSVTVSGEGEGNAVEVTGFLGSETLGAGNAGSVTVTGEMVTVNGATITSASDKTGQGGTIFLGARERLTLTDSTLSTTVTNVGDDRPTEGLGSIVLSAPTLNITGGSIQAETQGTRNAGNIKFNVGSLTTTAGKIRVPVDGFTFTPTTGVLISSSSTGKGPAGSVTIQGIQTAAKGVEPARSVSLTDTTVQTKVGAKTVQGSTPGNIAITAETVTVSNGTINATTSGPGKGGTITITATEGKGVVTLADPGPNPADVSRLIADTIGAGEAGDIVVKAKTLTVRDGAEIISIARQGGGDAGEITITATERVTLAGTNTRKDDLGRSILYGRSILSVATGATGIEAGGAGGEILVKAKTLEVMDGAAISSGTSGDGHGGTITIKAGTVIIDGAPIRILAVGDGTPVAVPSIISAQTTAGGNAGAVTVKADTVTLTDGAQIQTNTGRGGCGGEHHTHRSRCNPCSQHRDQQ